MKKENFNFLRLLFWGAVAAFILLGLFLLFAVVGYSFSALVSFGLAGLMLWFKMMRHLIRKDRMWAKMLYVVMNILITVVLTAAVVTSVHIAKGCAGNPNPDCEYVVVLGAGVHGTTPSLSLRSRLDAAYEYLTAHPDAIAIVSGGQGPGEDISEAQCMFDDLVSKGIDPARIWMEDKSTSTRENIRFTMALLEQRTGSRPEKINVLSNEFHLLRAGLMARDAGVTAYGIPAKTPYTSLFINYFLREIAALWNYWIFGG